MNHDLLKKLRNLKREDARSYMQSKIAGWSVYIQDIDEVLRAINQKIIISLGVVAYSRIVLSLISKKHIIFCGKYSKDIELLREFTKVICVEERFPKITKKIRSTGYLLKNFTFQNFLKKINEPRILSFYNITPHIYKTLKESATDYVGNDPDVQAEPLVKVRFRKILKKLNLPHLQDMQISREEFINKNYNEIRSFFNSDFVCQRGDLDVGGEIATFFIHNEGDFKNTQNVFKEDDRFSLVEINPYINGDSLSMVGCATKHGVFSAPLITQLIDIPESLRNYEGKGVFIGHDFGLKNYTDQAAQEATMILEKVGDYLYKNKYKGIFGIDFIFDKENQKIYPLECNPRFTGSFPMLSLLAINKGLPPFDLLHLVEHENISAQYNVAKLKNDYKFTSNFSHILIAAKDIKKMPVDLQVGIYSYDNAKDELTFERPALFPWEIKDKNEFLVVDSVLAKGADIGEGAVKLFKLIFPVSIALNSYQLKSEYAKIVKIFSDFLYDNKLDDNS